MTKEEKYIQDRYLEDEYKNLEPYNVLDRIKVSPYENDLWIVIEDFRVKEAVKIPKRFSRKAYVKNFDFILPKGFIYDAATIPRFLLRVTKGRHRPSYIVPSAAHDYGLRHAIGTRREVDFLFHHLLKKYDTEKITDKLMTAGVRLGSGAGWKNYRRYEKEIK